MYVCWTDRTNVLLLLFLSLFFFFLHIFCFISYSHRIMFTVCVVYNTHILHVFWRLVWLFYFFFILFVPLYLFLFVFIACMWFYVFLSQRGYMCFWLFKAYMWHAYFDSHIHTYILCVIHDMCYIFVFNIWNACSLYNVEDRCGEHWIQKYFSIFVIIWKENQKQPELKRVNSIYFCLVFELYELWKLYNRWIAATYDKCSSWSHVWSTWADNSIAQIQIVQRNVRKRYLVQCQYLVFFQFYIFNLLFDNMNKRFFFTFFQFQIIWINVQKKMSLFHYFP